MYTMFCTLIHIAYELNMYYSIAHPHVHHFAAQQKWTSDSAASGQVT